MHGRTVGLTLSGLLVLPAFGPVGAEAARLPADDRTVNCPKADYYGDEYTPCTNADFLLQPNATLRAHTTRSSDGVTIADLAVYEPGGGPQRPLRTTEYVDVTPWVTLFTNREKNTVLVKLRAMPSFAMDNDKAIAVVVRVVNAEPDKGTGKAVQSPPTALNPVVQVKQNGRVTVPVSDLASGKGDLRIGKLGEPRHGWVSLEKGRTVLVYKPFKNFKGTETFQYSVNQYNPQNRGEKQTALGVIVIKVVR
ncbi:Ig-like domain-containing protein [Streptomyces sp. NPDC004126]|uniref:Ig-like domain-containing protein n=1 Tax=Streptomyces sp. NPDC004126 TaxID=3390695 RepID=UPI003CFCA6D2